MRISLTSLYTILQFMSGKPLRKHSSIWWNSAEDYSFIWTTWLDRTERRIQYFLGSSGPQQTNHVFRRVSKTQNWDRAIPSTDGWVWRAYVETHDRRQTARYRRDTISNRIIFLWISILKNIFQNTLSIWNVKAFNREFPSDHYQNRGSMSKWSAILMSVVKFQNDRTSLDSDGIKSSETPLWSNRTRFIEDRDFLRSNEKDRWRQVAYRQKCRWTPTREGLAKQIQAFERHEASVVDERSDVASRPTSIETLCVCLSHWKCCSETKGTTDFLVEQAVSKSVIASERVNLSTTWSERFSSPLRIRFHDFHFLRSCLKLYTRFFLRIHELTHFFFKLGIMV